MAESGSGEAPKLTARLGVALAVVTLVATFVVVELFLRVAPGVIAVPLLVHFPGPLRHAVAARLDLPSVNDLAVIEPSARKDGGPALAHPKPGSVVRRALDPADVAAGAVETVTMDSRGFCNVPAAAARPTDDVVVIGDSFAFCLSVKPEETATAALERETGRSAYSLGVAGVGPRDYLELFRAYGLDLKPRYVVMNFYEGNDLKDTDGYETFRRTGEDRDASGRRVEEVLSWSYAASLVYAAFGWAEDAVDAMTGPSKDAFRYAVAVGGERVPMNVTNAEKSQVRYARLLKEGKVSLSVWTPALEDLKALAAEAGFTPIVTYTPATYTAYAKTVTFENPAVGADVAAMSAAQRRFLAEETAKLGVRFLDLTPALQRASESGPLTYFPANVHLTPRGHDVVAKEWARALQAADGAH